METYEALREKADEVKPLFLEAGKLAGLSEFQALSVFAHVTILMMYASIGKEWGSRPDIACLMMAVARDPGMSERLDALVEWQNG